MGCAGNPVFKVTVDGKRIGTYSNLRKVSSIIIEDYKTPHYNTFYKNMQQAKSGNYYNFCVTANSMIGNIRKIINVEVTIIE